MDEDEDHEETQPRQTTNDTTLYHAFYRSYQMYTDDLVMLRDKHRKLMRFDETTASLPRDRTVEGRPLHFVELGAKLDATPVIMMEANIHACEWITGASTFFLIDWLLTNYGSDAGATFLLDSYHLVIIPVANPDGYEYSRRSKDTRLWRKNRRTVGGCHGVDLNRNFNAFWASSEICSIEYPGSSAHSEPETRALESVFNHFQQRMVMYLAVHAYSQFIILPWTSQNSTNAVNSWHTEVGTVMATAMTASSGLRYSVGTLYALLGYKALGTSMDWAVMQKQDSNSNFLSIAYELRPHGSAGYESSMVLPASEIVSSGRELIASVVAAAARIYPTDA